MARIGRGQPIPVTIRGRLTYHRVSVDLPVFESVSEWPAVVVSTPNVTLTLPVFESVSEWPSLSLVYDQNFTLPVFESISEWPDLAVGVPIKPGDALTGANGQAEWNGTLLGAGTDFRLLIPVEGWLGTPNIDNLNVDRPNRHGSWNARKLAKQRIVTLRLQLDSAADPTQVAALIDQIIAVTGLPEDETPLPLVIKGFGEPKLAYGQVIDRPIAMNGDYNAGLPEVGLIIACADPRLYGLDARGATVPLNTETDLLNSGNTATNPTIRLEGPLAGPKLENKTTARTLEFDIEVDAGETLEIDTDNGTVTVGTASRMSTLTGTSVPVGDFTLSAGSNTIQYTVADGGANGADFLWRDSTI